jgi:NADPH:quinone reductase-like Zn-dependent oxidoreductase
MKAIVRSKYGPPEILEFEEIEKPVCGDDEVLVKVCAVALNPLDWHFLRGIPYLMRIMSGLSKPKNKLIGADFAGKVEAVGKNVNQFKIGDDVFGTKHGSLAEYITVRQDGAIAFKDARITFEQAAALPIAGLTALQGLRDVAQIKQGQRVLINGASGGVGTFAVQIAKYNGAEVTGVCSTKNVELVRSLGADYVIDYTNENFTKNGKSYDVSIDNIGNHSLWQYKKILNKSGVYVGNGGGSVNDRGFFGPIFGALAPSVFSLFVNQKMKTFLAKPNSNDLKFLISLMLNGKLNSVIDKQYKFSEIKEAMYYLEAGHVSGKLVITLEN